jgi:hypothetical protein
VACPAPEARHPPRRRSLPAPPPALRAPRRLRFPSLPRLRSRRPRRLSTRTRNFPRRPQPKSATRATTGLPPRRSDGEILSGAESAFSPCSGRRAIWRRLPGFSSEQLCALCSGESPCCASRQGFAFVMCFAWASPSAPRCPCASTRGGRRLFASRTFGRSSGNLRAPLFSLFWPREPP